MTAPALTDATSMNIFNKLNRFGIYLFVFLFPLFFLPVVSDSYEFAKMVLLLVFCLILLPALTFRIIKEKRLNWFPTGFGMVLVLLFLLSLISALFQAPNFITALTSPLGIATFAALCLYYFLAVHLEGNAGEKLSDILILSAGLVSVYSLLTLFKILPSSTNTPAGSLLYTAIYLGIISFLTLLRIFLSLKNGSVRRKIPGLILFLIINLAGFISIVYLISTNQKIILLPPYFGYLIVLEVFKGIRTLFLGVSPGNFLSAFTLAKPPAINSSPVWNIYFTSSSSYLYTLITEMGALTIVLYLFLLFQTMRNWAGKIARAETATLLVCLITMAFLPINTTILFLTVTLMAISGNRKREIRLDLNKTGNLIYLLSVPAIIFSVILFYLTGQLFLGEYYLKKSLEAASANNGNLVYQLQIKAINSNPYNDRYHLAFSQTNLALANAIAAKKEFTSDDKQNIPRLVQQSIDQAKIATVLNKTSIFNWENLANTYASLVTFASQSDKWAIQSYEQRILLDPVNPGGYLSLGGFYLSQKNLEEAGKAFRKAIFLKPDFANAHYNLGLVLSEKTLYEEAFKEMQTALAYLPPGSVDAKKVAAEMAVLQEKISGKIVKTEKKEPSPTTPLNILPTLKPTINL